MIGSIGRKKSVLNGERVYIRAIGLLCFYRAICRSRELCATHMSICLLVQSKLGIVDRKISQQPPRIVTDSKLKL